MLVAVLALAVRLPAFADGVMLVQAGAFWMGRDDGPSEERPQHRVYLRAYWIERHKVTNAEFAAFLNAHGIASRTASTGTTPTTPTRASTWCNAPAVLRPTVGRRSPAQAPRRQIYGSPTPASSIIPSWRSRGSARATTAPGRSAGCRPRRSGRRRRAATTSVRIRGARPRRRPPWPSSAAATTPPSAATRGRTAPAPTAWRTCSATCASGRRRRWARTLIVPTTGASPSPAGAASSCAAPATTIPGGSLHLSTRRSYDRRGAAAGHHHVGFRCATSEDLGGY